LPARLFAQLKVLIGTNVTVTGEYRIRGQGGHQHALASVIVIGVSRTRSTEAATGAEAEEHGLDLGKQAEDDLTEAEPPLDEEQSNVEAQEPPREPQRTGFEAVEGFYLALRAGNGAEAAQHVIPAKRRSGPLSANAMSSFYSDLKRPLQLSGVKQLGGGRYRASYTFETREGMRCEGTSVVTTVPVHGNYLISRIVAENGC